MILVTGGAGFVGRHLVARLAQAGQPVRVLIPSASQGPLREFEDKIDFVDGSVFQPEEVHRAMNGVHTVFHLASAQWWGSRRDLEHVDLGGTQNAIMAARSARIGRLIVLSHIGAEPSSGFALMRVKGQVEEAVRKSGVAYTIFRCGVLFGEQDRFTNNLAMILKTNPFLVFQPGHAEALLHPLHIDDLTQALVNSLEALDLVDNTLEIGGAEYMTFNEMIRTVMRVTNTQRQITSVPPYVLRSLTRNLRRVVPRFPITPQWFDVLAGNRTADIRNLYNYTGVSARRFEDTLVKYMPDRRYGLELVGFMLRRRRRSPF